VSIQGVHLQKEAVVFGSPLILTMPVSGLHIDLDELKNEATSYLTSVATSGVVFLHHMESSRLGKFRILKITGSDYYGTIFRIWI
jgi:hypothetical protein